MAAPLKIRFATETAGAKAGVQDLAASIVSNMVKVSGAVASNTEAAGAAASRLGATFGTGAQGVKTAATTIVTDLGAIGAAGLKAANDSNMSGVAIGAALGKAAVESRTGAAVVQASWAATAAGFSANAAIVKNEAAAVFRMLASSPTLVGLASGIALYAAFTAASNLARDSVQEFVDVASKARDLGVGASFLQRWTGEAKELNLEVRKLEAMLTSARDATTVRIGEGDKESGSAVGSRLEQNVRAGNLSRADLAKFTGASTSEAQIRVVLDLIEQLRTKGMQLASLDLAGKMFGPEFENQLRSGVDMVGRMKAALDSTSATAGGKRIISDEELRNAEQISAQIERVQRLLADGLAPIQRDLVSFGQAQYRGWLDIAEAIAGVVKKAGELYSVMSGILAQLDKLTTADPVGALATKLGATQIRDMLGIKPPENTETFGPNMPPGLRLTVNPRADKSGSLPSLKGGGGAGAAESEDAVERLIKQLEKANDTARAEFETVGKTNVEREKAVAMAKAEAAAREAGRSLTSEEVAKIQEAAEMTAVWKDKTKDLEQAQRQAADAMRSFGQMGADAFADMLLESKSFEDTLKSLEKQIAKMAINAVFTGSGPLAGMLGMSAPASAGANASGGLIGAIMSGFRANGGPVSAGRAYTVGEMGREIFVPSSDGRVVPIGRGGGSGAGGVSLTVNNSAGAEIQPTFRQSSNGDIEMIVDVVSRRQARDAGRGRGELARAGLVDQRLRG